MEIPSFQPLDNSNGVPIIVAERRRIKYPCRAVFVLILVALTVMTLGIIGSSILARFYGNQHTERMRFSCRLPYRSEDLNRQALLDFNSLSDEDNSQEIQLANTMDWMRDMFNNFASDANDEGSDEDSSSAQRQHSEEELTAEQLLDKFFTENVDLEMGKHPDDEGMTRIDVPDFKDGRQGRFLHDFEYNQTVILDKDTSRCFLMPLDRETVMPPTSFRQWIEQMRQGKYHMDMQVVQENMRVVLPAMDDFSSVSPRILNECRPATMRLYRLEKFVHGVVRRSADLETEAKFGVFSGRMVQYDLHNIDAVAKYEAAVAQA